MKVLTYEQIKNVEKSAVESGRFSYTDLMRNAGKAVFNAIEERYEIIGKRVLIIVGNGNNGGDGLVVAGLLRNAGAFVELYMPLGMPQSETAKTFLNTISDLPICNTIYKNYDFYIDALFGIGLSRLLSDDIAFLIGSINGKSGVKIAIDIPSGMFADGGSAQAVFSADLTVTFIGYKLCQLLPDTSSYCGEVILDELGIDIYNNYSYSIIEPPKAHQYDKNSHKGTFGTALLICGSYGMCGAEILSAKAALVSGAGIVKAVVCDKNYSAFTGAVPEAVTIPVETSASGTPVIYEKTALSALSNASALLIGCGLGHSDDAVSTVRKFLSFTNVPTVIDADGINAIARDISILRNIKAPYILTPHPGEMARLLNTTVADIENNRVRYAKTFACTHQCTVVLKGANTIVASPDGEVFFNTIGNYGMAKGGSGDVLSGIIVALLANGYDTLSAALTAVYVHARSGDRAAKKYSRRTMLPSDIIKELKFISF